MLENQTEEWLHNSPILIYGQRKAGTTLLQNLLDGGEVFVYPTELKLKYLKDIDFENEFVDSIKKYSDISIVKPLDGLDFDHYRKLLTQPNLSNSTDTRELILNDILAVYKSCQSLVKPLMWAVKEVGGDTLDIIKFWRALFPNTKILMISRSPLRVTRAVLMDRKRRGIKLNIKSIIRETIDPIQVLNAQMTFHGKPGVYFVRYEELTDSPESTMNDICDYLSVSRFGKMYSPTIFGKKTVVNTSSRNEDKVFNVNKKWYQDLSFFDTFIIALTYSALYVSNIFRLKNKIRFSNKV